MYLGRTSVCESFLSHQVQRELAGGVAAEPWAADRGRRGHTGATDPGCPALANEQEVRVRRSGTGPDLQSAIDSTGWQLWTESDFDLIYSIVHPRECVNETPTLSHVSIFFLISQIVKILTLYSPQSDAEERVTLNFIRIVQVKLFVLYIVDPLKKPL